MILQSLIFTLTTANNITSKQAGAPGTSSSLPILIKYVWYSITVLLLICLEAIANVDFPCVLQIQKIFYKHIHTENKNFHYKLQCSFHKTPTTKTEIVRLFDQMLWKLENDHMNG